MDKITKTCKAQSEKKIKTIKAIAAITFSITLSITFLIGNRNRDFENK